MVNQLLYTFCLGTFLALPPLALIARYLRPSSVPWWAIALGVSLGGWLLANATVYFYYEHLDDLIKASPNPPQELVDRWVADGAKRVFALLFGWLYGPIYSVPYFAAFGLAVFIRSKTRDNQSA